MSIQAMMWVFDHSKAKGNARLVLLAIANHVSDDGEGWCYVSTILREANCSYAAYRRVTNELIEAGELARSVNDGAGLRSTRPDAKPNHWEFPHLTGRGAHSEHPVADRPARSARPAGRAKGASRALPSKEPLEEPLVELALDLPAVVDPVVTVWDTWRTLTGHHRAVLDDKRRRRIQRALKTFPLEDVLAAVQGWQHSPWHRGENPNRTVYDDIGTLLRDAAQIEKMRDLFLDATAVPDTTERDRDIAGMTNDGVTCATCEGKSWVFDEATQEAAPCPVCRAGIIP